MKRLLLCAFLLSPVLALAADDYPLTLTVISAERYNHGGYITTNIIGWLSDDPQRQQLHMVCDTGIFSRGPDGRANRYAARRNKPHEIKIGAREMGKDKIKEHTCKY
ncbi:MAG TPA: hypothetical protein VFU50_01290 [Terriglobales bacterium]|nr:hypothetical protein [Terriglobales bacterium]